jgi:predicted SAM-dependent methyltransferase
MKLHVGCGPVNLPGWINIDHGATSSADIRLDITQGLPYDSESIDLIYSEHFIEHFTVEQGVALFRDFHRVLKPGGVVRTATPDMRFILKRYFFMWRRQEWLTRYGYEYIQTRAEMVNIGFREWGHQYIYDEEELVRRLKEAGFQRTTREKLNRSRHVDLRNLETRKDSTLIVEATR